MAGYFSKPRVKPFPGITPTRQQAVIEAKIIRNAMDLPDGQYMKPGGRRRAQIRLAKKGK